MKTEAEIKKMLDEALSDERLTYPAATVFNNAPLALVQMALETKIHLLQNILELPYSLPKIIKVEKNNLEID